MMQGLNNINLSSIAVVLLLMLLYAEQEYNDWKKLSEMLHKNVLI
jgi:hypothetical protein